MKKDFFTSVRMTLGLPFAAIITAGLFLMMGGLIKTDVVKITPPEPDKKITILREVKPPPTEPIIKPSPAPSAAPESSRPTIDGPGKPDALPMPQNPKPTVGTVGPDIRTEILLPDVKTAFAYPDRCASRGIEGTVIVEFDVAPDGSVINPRIISSPDSCLDQATLRGIRNWKYRPSQDGKIRRNIREQISYQLTDV